MIGYDTEKKNLINGLINLKKQICPLYEQDHPIIVQIDELIRDMEEDTCLVVTIGEFNTGKSTFVNALLSERLMPMGVTPTTATINVLKWGNDRKLEIFYRNGEVTQKELSEGILKKFVASSEFNEFEVERIEMTLPSRLLEERITVIDTPGLNDLNELRSEITYQLIPRADVILFMLNSTMALKKSEYRFLKDTILTKGTDRVLFIANFIDNLDEDEEEELIREIQQRIRKIKGFSEAIVLPLSSYDALQGRLEDDEQLVEFSGIEAVEKKMQEMIHDGSNGKEKLKRFRFRASQIISSIHEDLQAKERFIKASVEELNEQVERVKQWQLRQKDREEQISMYIHERKQEMNIMVQKSVSYFIHNLKEDLEFKVQSIQSGNIKKFIEVDFPYQLRRSIKNWLEQYTPHIHELLRKLEVEISRGLSESFQEEINVTGIRRSKVEYNYEEESLLASDQYEQMDPGIVSGLLIGGVGTLAMLLGGGIFSPLALAGFPILKKHFEKNQLNEVKPALLSEVNNRLVEIETNLNQKIEDYMNDAVRNILDEATELFRMKSKMYLSALQKEIERKTGELKGHDWNEEKLSLIRKEINSFNRHIMTKQEDDKNGRLLGSAQR